MESQKRTGKKKRPKQEHVSTKTNQVKKKKQLAASKKAKLVAKKRRNKQKRLIIDFFGAIIITGLVLFLLSLFLFSLPKVEGYSMVPTLREGDRVYVDKLGKLKKFELVYVQLPGTKEKQIRRIIGMPGQKIIYKNDQLQIDRQDQKETFIDEEKQLSQENGRFFTEDFSLFKLTEKSVIPEDSYLLLGDNRPYSIDSRSYGFVDRKAIIGVVKMRILPLHLIQAF
ncbi:signal peptidase I [Candidatus Enterococcus mansonii]|uniref:Signal peptidase I n=1 Tax=Candidatus Enterococcus mansonii TaxID=1834181 RepID=A0A242CGH8_9ENTE|nr:signal peptidase I [Enterococcus sp. 4G2_DIV0659]OTO09354.1 signal peptidase I [Enterococcus sp. 4G2_DIV0659]